MPRSASCSRGKFEIFLVQTLGHFGVHAQLFHTTVTERICDPGRIATEVKHLDALQWLNGRHDLDGTGSVANNANPLVSQIIALHGSVIFSLLHGTIVGWTLTPRPIGQNG